MCLPRMSLSSPFVALRPRDRDTGGDAMRRPIGINLVMLALVVAFPLPAQQQPPKAPPLPPINPATARLDQTISDLGGAGFAVAYSEPRETLIAACENGTIQAWKKDV